QAQPSQTAFKIITPMRIKEIIRKTTRPASKPSFAGLFKASPPPPNIQNTLFVKTYWKSKFSYAHLLRTLTARRSFFIMIRLPFILILAGITALTTAQDSLTHAPVHDSPVWQQIQSVPESQGQT